MIRLALVTATLLLAPGLVHDAFLCSAAPLNSPTVEDSRVLLSRDAGNNKRPFGVLLSSSPRSSSAGRSLESGKLKLVQRSLSDLEGPRHLRLPRHSHDNDDDDDWGEQDLSDGGDFYGPSSDKQGYSAYSKSGPDSDSVSSGGGYSHSSNNFHSHSTDPDESIYSGSSEEDSSDRISDKQGSGSFKSALEDPGTSNGKGDNSKTSKGTSYTKPNQAFDDTEDEDQPDFDPDSDNSDGDSSSDESEENPSPSQTSATPTAYRPFSPNSRGSKLKPTSTLPPGPAQTFVAQSSSSDCANLAAFYAATGGALWANNLGWNSGQAAGCCAWFGVTCGANGQVTALDLAFNGLHGSLALAPSLFSLSGLSRMNLSGNAMGGAIPDTFGTLPGLTQLYLDSTGLTGPLPPSLMALPDIQTVHLANNTLTGRLAFPGATALSQIYVGQNAFTSIELRASLNLTKVAIDRNQLSGVLPDLTTAAKLQIFTASNNAFTGDGFGLAALSQLQRFDVSANQLVGSYPDPTHCPQLQVYAVDHNNWTGPFPIGAAPSFLASCQVGPVAYCPDAGTMSDPTSLASKCAIVCGANSNPQLAAAVALNTPGTLNINARSLHVSGLYINSGHKRKPMFRP